MSARAASYLESQNAAECHRDQRVGVTEHKERSNAEVAKRQDQPALERRKGRVVEEGRATVTERKGTEWLEEARGERARHHNNRVPEVSEAENLDSQTSCRALER